ncbi:hypothetical protein ACJZ2D_002650 [Fusarium nematophilum]
MQSLLILSGIALAYAAYTCLSSLRHNIAEAKKSGLPYIIAPCSPIFLPWQLTHKLWIPIIRLFPRPWWERWLEVLTPGFSYRTCHDGFARYGDVFIIVSPKMLFLMACNAEAIRQFTSRREHFPKYVETYEILRQFGDNVLASEGAVWRMHRKVTSASFNEKNAALVFREAIQQAQGMVKMWMGADGEDSGTIHSLDRDTMRLALNIIAYVGFGLKLLWPGESLPSGADSKLAKYGSLEPSSGHKLSFVTTVATVLEYILMLLLVPRWLLRLMPFKKARLAADSHEDWCKYMQELMDEKIEEAQRGEHVDGMDLMGQLVRSSYGTATANGNPPHLSGRKKEVAPKQGSLSRDEIQGNAFIMLVAGHETTANAMHFILLELANNPASQRRLQKDIDELLGGKDPSLWDYEGLINPMMASMLGACMNETLRMVPAVVEIPKKVTPSQDQVITIDETRHVIPRSAIVSLVAVSVHRNPRYWPGRPSKLHDGEDDINDWVPERWFRKNEASSGTSSETEDSPAETEDFGGYGGPDTSSQLFRPERGSYIPFSDGPRSCLGRRIAQVEIIAALAVLFRDFSLELAVDEWADDEEVQLMDRKRRREVYALAQAKSREKILGATSVLTLKMNDDHVPVRLVKRGHERFALLGVPSRWDASGLVLEQANATFAYLPVGGGAQRATRGFCLIVCRASSPGTMRVNKTKLPSLPGAGAQTGPVPGQAACAPFYWPPADITSPEISVDLQLQAWDSTGKKKKHKQPKARRTRALSLPRAISPITHATTTSEISIIVTITNIIAHFWSLLSNSRRTHNLPLPKAIYGILLTF